MRIQLPSRAEEPQIELIPLIDVILVLLIFFVITTTFDSHSAMQLELPHASQQPDTSQTHRLSVLINASGHYFINNQETIRTDIDTLKRSIAQIAGDDRTQPVLLRADARTPYQAVITAQDALTQLGFRHLTIATVVSSSMSQ